MALGCRIRRNFERPSKELVEAFRGIPVANIDDNCGKIAAVDSSIGYGSAGRCYRSCKQRKPEQSTLR